jgi:Helix-turn-helix domain
MPNEQLTTFKADYNIPAPTALLTTTLNVRAAAKMLHIHPVTLQKLARAGEIPGAKIGKAWVFLEIDMIEYIRSQCKRRVLQSESKEINQCHSTNAMTHRDGGSKSTTTAEQYKKALGLHASERPRNIMTDSRRRCGNKEGSE